ncbi:MAG: beta-ketoacyl-[acyl-carrier-protein] synthase family protein [Planctomycetaceae bacterium]|nr:beta-ketoacyl-[acyl-carrier-protein] synthase family protein [Planctomycetaceae bacterium]
MRQTSEIVITGMGVVSPIGIGTRAVWESLLANRSGVRFRPGMEQVQEPWAMAGSVEDFDGKAHIAKKSLKVMCREIQMGFAAAAMAIEDAKLSPGLVAPPRIATVFASEAFYANPADLVPAFRQCITLGNDVSSWGQVAPREIEPLWMLKYLPNMAASHISILLDAQGPSNTVVLGDNSSLPAMIEGIELLQRGWADVVVVGATSSQLNPTATVYRDRLRMANWTSDPTLAVRPFEANRGGTVFGEGAAAFIVETLASAQARGAPILARVLGSNRAWGKPEQSSARLARSVQDTLERSGVCADEVGHINANGTGVLAEDRLEAQGLASVLPYCPVFAAKSYFGLLGPATGAVELVCSLLAIRQGILPATLNYETPDPDCPVRVAAVNSPLGSTLALVTNQAPAGQIATLLIEGATTSE